MAVPFDPGYTADPYATLAAAYPGEGAYPPANFRTEWGPIFHRGRLDGTARILVIGQDPAAHEAICRRILVGEAGQRVQGFLARLGVTSSYVMINAFVYSVYGHGGAQHVNDKKILRYRNAWLDALAAGNGLQGIVSLGQLADKSYRAWKTTPAGEACTAVYATMRHPTFPESASASGSTTFEQAMADLVASWNTALDLLHPVVDPDRPTRLRHFKTTVQNAVAPIPAADLPAGLPAWMTSIDPWAARTGSNAQEKRASITVSVPANARTWPPVT